MTYVFAIIAIATIAWVLLPFRNQNSQEVLLDQVVDPIEKLAQEKENLLQSIRELDFDYETGKISGKDYKSLRADLEKQTVGVMKSLEDAKLKWQEMEQSL